MNLRTLPRWILAIVATALTLLCLETAGRWALPSPPPRADGLVADAQLGWALPANTTMSWRGTPARINTLGLRGAEPKTQPKLARVLIVGDSSVFGDGVNDKETMSAQLSRRLGSGFEVQNGGVPGYTCPQTRTLFDRVRTRFVPDTLVVYNMHSDYRRAGPDDRVIIRSQLGWFGNTGIGQLVAAGKLWVRIVKERPNLDVQAYQTCLVRLAEDHLRGGTELVFVVPITDVDFPDSPLFGLPDPSPPGLRLSDYRNAMRAAAQATGGATVDGPAVALSAKLDGATALLDEVHPSPAGHGVLADAIADAIQGTR